jgi:phenylacetaldehyde dehydrogenase
VSLELGGKSPNVVFADADLDAAIAGAASAIFFNHGQCCCAGSRLYVEKNLRRGRRRRRRAGEENQVGPVSIPNADGPAGFRGAVEPVCGYLESGFPRAQGRRWRRRPRRRGYFVEPTVLVNTTKT